jgi:signal transduction histidine kinase
VATGLLILTTTLFLISYFKDDNLFKTAELSENYIQISFLFNFFFSLAISIAAVYFMMNLSKLSEAELMKKEIQTNQKNLELQKVNAELDNFVYRVSHDLRSPLSSILGLTNLAKLTNDPAEINKILEMIQGRVNAQDIFIREIIHYSRNARTELLIEDVNLEHLINHVLEELRFIDAAEKIEFRKNLGGNVIVKTDKIRLWIILSNLIGNAIKYHDLTKEYQFIEIGFLENISTLYVKDNGIGIQQDNLCKIFGMFYRGSDRSTGSGLGLFIAQEAASRLGSSIEVESVYEQGSTFKVCLARKIHGVD